MSRIKSSLMATALARRGVQGFVASIAQSVHLLDVGCGNSSPLESRLKARVLMDIRPLYDFKSVLRARKLEGVSALHPSR